MGSLPGVHFLILDLKTDNVKEFQCTSRYNVVQSFLPLSECRKWDFFGGHFKC